MSSKAFTITTYAGFKPREGDTIQAELFDAWPRVPPSANREASSSRTQSTMHLGLFVSVLACSTTRERCRDTVYKDGTE